MISAESVRNLFGKSGIKNVAIIDDVFNSPGQNLTAADVQTVYEQLEEAPELLALLSQTSVVNDPLDISPTVIDNIKKFADEGQEHAQVLWEIIRQISDAKKSKLSALASSLRKDLKLTVKKISAATAASKRSGVVPDDSNVIFLDYELDTASPGGELSAAIVGKIFGQFKGKSSVPLLILMSSNDLSDEVVSEFQRKSDFLSGMFYFVPKDDLYDQEKLHYRLAAFAKALPTGQVLQGFVEELGESLSKAGSSVFTDLRSLSIADYAFLQSMRLHDDGQPMGEYLMWMISAHLLKELASGQAMKTVEKRVSELSFDDLPPTNARPSAALSALYSSAVMRLMTDLPDPAIDPSNYLQFGDLFRKGASKNVFACITPPCDLAFGPTRKIPSDRSIMFLPGTLFPIEKPLKPFDQRQPRTELVQLAEKTYRIVWDTKGCLHISWGDLRNKLAQMNVKRVARLNTPFALEVQRSFANDLTRIGMPVPPPIYNPVLIEMHCLDESGKEKVLTEQSTSHAHLSASERGEKLVLGAAFMDRLPAMLATATEFLTARHAALLSKAKEVGPGAAANVQTAIDKITAARQNADSLSAMRGPFALASDGEPQIVLDDLLVIQDGPQPIPSKDWIPLRIRLLRAQDSTGTQ
jgi:hypothetical protein